MHNVPLVELFKINVIESSKNSHSVRWTTQFDSEFCRIFHAINCKILISWININESSDTKWLKICITSSRSQPIISRASSLQHTLPIIPKIISWKYIFSYWNSHNSLFQSRFCRIQSDVIIIKSYIQSWFVWYPQCVFRYLSKIIWHKTWCHFSFHTQIP